MIARPTATAGAVLLAGLDVAVVVAPAAVLALTARKGGMPTTQGFDLLAASAVVGLVHGRVVWNRLRDEVTHAHRLADVWIAAFDSLVVLALGATLLLLFILGGFAEQHAALLNQGWPILGLWIGIQLLAVAIAELSGRWVFNWLEPHRPADGHSKGAPPGLAERRRPQAADAPSTAGPAHVGAVRSRSDGQPAGEAATGPVDAVHQPGRLDEHQGAGAVDAGHPGGRAELDRLDGDR